MNPATDPQKAGPPYANLVRFSSSPSLGEPRIVFFDGGAHHGFWLPAAGDRRHAGAFGGPTLLSCTDRLASPWMLVPSLRVDGRKVALGRLQGTNATEPGFLQQHRADDRVGFQAELGFPDAETTLVTYRVENRGRRPLWVSLDLSGRLGAPGTVEREGSEVHWTFGPRAQPETLGLRLFQGSLQVRGRSYRAAILGETTLEPGETAATAVLVWFRAWGLNQDRGNPIPAGASPRALRQQIVDRWQPVLGAVERRFPEAHRPLAVKCLQVLEANRKAPTGDLKSEGIYPDSHFFKAFWGWDTWKHSHALATLDPGLAASGLRSLYDFLDAEGFLPDNVFPLSARNNRRNGKPPLSGWALAAVVEASGDRALARELYPLVVRQHRWWFRFRDHDGDGLCGYGSQDGSLQAAKWESGMDNAARFDGRKMVANPQGGWSCTLDSVDLNCYLVVEKRALATLARGLGKPDDALAWGLEAQALADRIEATFFDEGRGYYFDVDLFTKKPIRTAGCEGWLPLWAGTASPSRAAAVRDKMMDPRWFNTFVPLPSLAAWDPSFMRGSSYWRGRVWVDQAAFGIEGLRRYGFDSDADILTEKLMTRCRGLSSFPGTLRENYSPHDGTGMGSPMFSWTAASVLDLLGPPSTKK